MDAVLNVLTEMAKDGLLPDGGITEIELIGDIFKTVLTKLDNRTTYLLEITQNLGHGRNWKTTIARANQNLGDKSFLANLRAVWDQDGDKVYLQEQLLSGVLKTRRMNLHNIELGRIIIRESLRQKRKLFVLDDINNLDQLNALCESRSGLIFTTADEHLLNVLQEDNI
ncbi:Disease resistance protein RML1B, partial [Mucuna pruriens]